MDKVNNEQQPWCRWAGIVLIRGFLICCVTLPMPSLANEHREYIIKAGFIYNFTRFVEWPEKQKEQIEKSGLVFCVAGKNRFGSALKKMASKFKSRGISMKTLLNVPLEDLPSCHVLFVDRSKSDQVEALVDRVREYPVLTVGDSPGFASRGLGINFFVLDNKIRFEVNPEAAKRGGLWVSSELMGLARIVKGGEK